ncbi:cytochrome P450 93A3-like protein, partial [Tanacetum coccineum]
KKLKDIIARFDVILEKMVDEHEEARKHTLTGQVKDLLDVLVDIKHDESMDIKLTRENIKALIQNLFFAATDTTLGSLEWIISELINHPDIMRKAREEIYRVVGRNILVQESDIPNFPYLQAIVKEIFCLHPSTTLIQRKSPRDCTVSGYHIPANANVLINIWALYRDPNHWDKPHERMCPGISLAQHMIHTTLGGMIQCFDWKAGKEGTLPSVDMEEGAGVTLSRANPLICIPMALFDPIPFSV